MAGLRCGIVPRSLILSGLSRLHCPCRVSPPENDGTTVSVFTFSVELLVRSRSISAILACTVAVLTAVPAMGQATKKKAVTHHSTSASPSVAAPWRLAYRDATVTVTVDTSHTRKTADGFFQTHIKWVYAKDQAIEHHRSYRTLVEDRLLDCDYVQTKPINATVYDAKGNVVNSFTTPLSDVQYMSWSRRKAGTANERALTGVCHLLRPTAKNGTKSGAKSVTRTAHT